MDRLVSSDRANSAGREASARHLGSGGRECLAREAARRVLPSSIHPGPEPSRLGRLLIVVPSILPQPGHGLGDVARLCAALPDRSRVVLGAADDQGRVDPALNRRLECLPRRFPGVRVWAPGRVELPKGFKLTGTILRERHTRTRGAPRVRLFNGLFFGLFSPQRCGTFAAALRTPSTRCCGQSAGLRTVRVGADTRSRM